MSDEKIKNFLNYFGCVLEKTGQVVIGTYIVIITIGVLFFNADISSLVHYTSIFILIIYAFLTILYPSPRELCELFECDRKCFISIRNSFLYWIPWLTVTILIYITMKIV